MAYPPVLPPSTRSDSTLMAGAHAQDHNKIAAALDDFIAELGASPSGGYADLTSRLLDLPTTPELDAALVDAISPLAVGADAVTAATGGTLAALPANSAYPFDMDRQGRLLRGNGLALQRSSDNGATWATIYTFAGQGPIGVRQLDNGEILVGTGDNYPTNTVKSALWVSTNYENAGALAFTKKLTATDYQQTIGLGWGFGGAGSTYVVSEYDSKAPGARSANQRAWLTQDSGNTWAQLYDHGTGALSTRHIHGAAYDPHRGAIWLTLGDYTGPGDGNRKIIVSWDLGGSWTTVTTDQQPTAIMVFPDCVAFGSDNPPNGVLRIDNPSPTSLVLRQSYRLNQYENPPGTPQLSHVAERPFRARTPQGYLTLLPFTSATAGQSGRVLGSYDGFVWFEVWRDSRTYGSNKGPKVVVGPTPQGTVHIAGNDDSAGLLFSVALPMSGAPGLVGAISRIAKGLRRAIPHRSYMVLNRASPAQTYVQYTEVQVAINPVALVGDDVSGLFTPAADGVVVNRDCYVRYEAATGINPATFGNFSHVFVTLDGVGASERDFGPKTTGIIKVRAGQKLGVKVNPNPYNGNATGGTALILDAWEQHV